MCQCKNCDHCPNERPSPNKTIELTPHELLAIRLGLKILGKKEWVTIKTTSAINGILNKIES